MRTCADYLRSARVGGHSGAFAAKGATRRPDSVPARRGSAIESASGARVRSTAKNAIGPALRLRDGPPPEVLDISSDDETWRFVADSSIPYVTYTRTGPLANVDGRLLATYLMSTGVLVSLHFSNGRR